MEQTQRVNQGLRITKIVLNVLFYTLLVFLLIFSIVTISSKDPDDIPSVFGKGFLSVQSNSMKDVFEKGDLVFVKKLDKAGRESLKEGDIVTFYDGTIGRLNTHRITRIVGDMVYTQGDNETNEDAPRQREFILAKYTGHWNNVGGTIDFLQTQLGFGLIIVLPMFLLLVYQGYVLIRDVFAIKKDKLVKEHEVDREAEKERIRKELLEELKKEQEQNKE